MIDEIFQEYKKQENETLILMTEHLDINVKRFLYRNINNDLIFILDSVNLLNEEIRQNADDIFPWYYCWSLKIHFHQ